MCPWKVGQILVCDRTNYQAQITDVYDTDNGSYITIYDTDRKLSLSSHAETLCRSGWQVKDVD